MKRHLLPLLLLAGVVGLPVFTAQAQDKPVLNTAPPGPPPTPPRPVETVPAPTPQPDLREDVPGPPPTPNAPSGMDFPNRANTKAGGVDAKPLSRKFLYTNLGLGLSSYNGLTQFNISAAPAIGFRITDKFAVGPGISYAYSSFSLPSNSRYVLTAKGDKSINTSSLGLKAFAQYIVYKEFFVHGEYEVTSAELVDQDANLYFYKYKRNVATPLAGIGYRNYLGENAAVDIVALYNFDSTISSLYPPLVVRFSFLFNFGK